MTQPDFSTTDFACLSCNEVLKMYAGYHAFTLVCPACGTVQERDINGFKETGKMEGAGKDITIPLGSRGMIKGSEYVVTGYAYCNEKGTKYNWEEYSLFNPIAGIAWLSVYNGHWVFLRELDPLGEMPYKHLLYEGFTHHLFGRYKSQVMRASGEFMYRLDPDETTSAREYIFPPSMVSVETTGNSMTWLHGEHINHRTIRKAFNLGSVPDRIGVGMIQPYFGKFKPETLVSLCLVLGILWVGLQFYFVNTASETELFKDHLVIVDSMDSRELFTGTFNIGGGTRNLEVVLNADIDNNWMYSGVTLVNEQTGDIYNTELEAEFYRGYSDGESWTEGSTRNSIVISQVPAGRYYLILYPVKPSMLSQVHIDVSVIRDVYVFSNGLILLILLAVFPVYYFYLGRLIEQRRWNNSDYSIYE